MTFDPYHKWLGIAPKDQPPNHYRLLAIDLFESDPEVIDAAANRQMAYLQQRATGPHAALSQKLLNEIAAARLCLLDPRAKAEYDAHIPTLATQPRPVAPPILSDLDAGAGAAVKPPAMTDPWDEFAPLEKSVPLLQPRSRTTRFTIEPWHWVAAVGILVILGFGAWTLFMRGDEMYVSGKASPLQVQVAELEAKITEWQASRDKLAALLTQLRQDKADVLQKLNQLGIRSDSDLGTDPKAEVLARELKDIVRDTAIYEKKHQEYDLAILKSESHLRSIARRLAAESAGVSDAELEELSRSMISLEASLAAENTSLPIDMENTLQKELASHRQEDGTAAAATAEPSPQSTGSNTQSQLTTPEAPAIFDVTIFPSWAELEVSSGNGTITGEGRTRQVKITSGGGFRLGASSPGYAPSGQWYPASPGERRAITLALVRASSNSPTASTENVAHGKTNSSVNSGRQQMERNTSSTTKKTAPSSKPQQGEKEDWIRWSGSSVTVFDGNNLTSWSVCDKRSIESVVTLNHQNRSMVFKENAAIYPRIIDSGEPPRNVVLTASFLCPQASRANFFVRRDRSVEISEGFLGQIHIGNGKAIRALPVTLSPRTWNTLQIMCNGTRWTVKINGQLINQAEGDSADPYNFCILADPGFEVRDIRVRKLD